MVDLQQRIDATDRAVDVPVATSAAKKVATAELVRTFAEVERLLAQMDLLLFPLRAADPNAYARYGAARQVFDRRGSGGTATEETPAAPATLTAPENATATVAAPVPLKAAA